MRKLTALTGAALIAATFASAAFAQQVNNAPGGISFFGNVARSDHNLGWVSVTGNLTTPDVIIHIVDGWFDTTCTIKDASQVYEHKLTEDGGGLSLYPHTCYNTRTNASVPVAKNAVLNFDWYYSNPNGDWNIAAQQMYLMLPGFCDYDGFAGVGTVTQIP